MRIDDYMSLEAAAVSLGCSIATVRREIARGKLRSGWRGGRRVIAQIDVDVLRAEREEIRDAR
jgi:hypothetical protein